MADNYLTEVVDFIVTMAGFRGKRRAMLRMFGQAFWWSQEVRSIDNPT
jgi:hypothetical protein